MIPSLHSVCCPRRSLPLPEASFCLLQNWRPPTFSNTFQGGTGLQLPLGPNSVFVFLLRTCCCLGLGRSQNWMRPRPSRLLLPESGLRAGRAARSTECGFPGEEMLRERGKLRASPPLNVSQPPPTLNAYPCFKKVYPASLSSPIPNRER